MNELENIKVGDKVIVGRGYVSDLICNVERITKTQIIVNGRRFSKKNGRLVGGDVWSCDRLTIATDEKIEKLKRDKRRRTLKLYLQSVNWDVLSIESLTSISELVKKELGNSAAKQ